MARTEVITFLRDKVPTQDNLSEEAKGRAKDYIASLPTPSSTSIPTGDKVDTSKGDASKLTTKQEPTITYPPAADWGMRVTQVDTNKSYFFSLLPAMDSVIPMTASKDVPNALPGLHIRVKANIAKLRVPGSTPIYQHMGIDSVMITVVGMFTGVDGDKPSPATYLSHATGKDKVGTLMAKLDTYGAMQSFYEHAYLSGADLDVEINMARYQAFDVKEGVIRSAKTGNPRFRGHLSLLEVAHARSDRTYYTLQFETRSLTEDKCEITKIDHIPASLSEAVDKATKDERTSEVKNILDIHKEIELARGGKEDRTYEEWESGDPNDPLRVQEVCKNGTCRYFVSTPSKLYEETDKEAIDKLKNERIGAWNFNRIVRTGAGIAATVTSCVVAAGSIPAAATVVGGVLTGLAAIGCGAVASDLVNTVVNGDNRQYTATEAAIDAVTILAPTKIGAKAIGKVADVGAKVVSKTGIFAGKVVSKTGILRTGPGAKIVASLTQSTQNVRTAILSTANKAKGVAVDFAQIRNPTRLQPPKNYLTSNNAAVKFARFITPGLGPISNITNVVDDAGRLTQTSNIVDDTVTNATRSTQTSNIVDDTVTNATRSTLTRRDIPNIDKVSQESGDIAIRMHNENVPIDDVSRWIADNYPDANPGEVLRAKQIIRNNVYFPVEDDPASLATTLYKEGYNPQDMDPDELINYIRNARPGISDEIVTSLKNGVLSEYNKKYPRAITEEGVYNNIIEIANTLSPDATQAQKLEALENISDKEGALKVLNEVLNRRLTSNIRVTSVKPPEETLPSSLNPDGTPATLGPAAGSIDGEPLVLQTPPPNSGVSQPLPTNKSIGEPTPLPTGTVTAPPPSGVPARPGGTLTNEVSQPTPLPQPSGVPVRQTPRVNIGKSTPPAEVAEIARIQAQAILDNNPNINPDTLSNSEILLFVEGQVSFIQGYNKKLFSKAVRDNLRNLKLTRPIRPRPPSPVNTVNTPPSPVNRVISIKGKGLISQNTIANDITALIPDVGNLPDAVLRNEVIDYLEGNQAIYNPGQVEEIVNLIKQNNPGSPIIPRVANTDDIQDMQLPNEPGTPTNQVVGQAPDTTTGRATIHKNMSFSEVERIANNQAQAILKVSPDINPDTVSDTEILNLIDVSLNLDDKGVNKFVTSIRKYIRVLKQGRAQ